MPMPKGRSGNPAGRPKGAKNKVKSKLQLSHEHILKMLKDKKTPLDFMLGIMMEEKVPLSLRFECAKAAAPYVHRKQPQAIEGTNPGDPVSVHHKGGVMMVPLMGDVADWEKMAQAAQTTLMTHTSVDENAG